MKEATIIDTGKSTWGNSGSIDQLLRGKKRSLSSEAQVALINLSPNDLAALLYDSYETVYDRLIARDEHIIERVRLTTNIWKNANHGKEADLLANIIDLDQENDNAIGIFFGSVVFGPTDDTWSIFSTQTDRFISKEQLTEEPGNIGIQRLNIILSILSTDWIGTQKRRRFLDEANFSDFKAVEERVAPLFESPLLPVLCKQMLAQIIAYHVDEPESLSPTTLFYAVGNHTGDGKHVDAAASVVLASPENSQTVARLIDQTPAEDITLWSALECMRWGDKAHLVPLVMKKFIDSDFSPTQPLEIRLNMLETFAGLLDRSLLPIYMGLPSDTVSFKEELQSHVSDELLGAVFDSVISRWEHVAWAVAEGTETIDFDKYIFRDVAKVMKTLWSYGATREGFYSSQRVNQVAAFLITIQRYPRNTFQFWYDFDSVVLDVVNRLQSNV